MNSKNRIIFIMIFLLLLLSTSVSFVNYYITLKSTEEHLEKASLPLSTDNIYNEIQTHLIEPNLVASMMAQDTFLKDWLVNDEQNEMMIKAYLESIKNKYQMSTVFLASEGTQNYYLPRGFVEKMKESNPTNSWYYELKEKGDVHEVNIDFNQNIDNSMFMFINHKIYDEKYHLLGVTGVGIKISYIDEMLKRFRQDYKFNVLFIDKKGEIVLYERSRDNNSTLDKYNELLVYKDSLLSNEKKTVKYYDSFGEDYIVHSKYIPEVDLYLLVQAKVSDFTVSVIQTFYMNLFISLFGIFMIVFIIVKMGQHYSIKLENLANNDSLTKLPNRRVFYEQINQLILLNQRKKIDVSILFFDLDDFKKINDTLGHITGDKVLERIAEIVKENVRESDLFARWGGEEFIIAFVNASMEDAENLSEKLRVRIEDDYKLHKILNSSLTASFGLTQMLETDTVDKIVHRVDDTMYKAKMDGKNRVYSS